MNRTAAARQRLKVERELHARLTPELRRQLVRIARSCGCDGAQADDAAQAALIELWRNPEALLIENARLLRRITRDCALKTLRSARRHDLSGRGDRFVAADWLPEHEPGSDAEDWLPESGFNG